MVELKQTTELMLSNDYKERFKGEYWQLKIRLSKLIDLLVLADSGKLNFEPNTPIELLKKQMIAMHKYLDILKKRAEYEGVVLHAKHPERH